MKEDFNHVVVLDFSKFSEDDLEKVKSIIISSKCRVDRIEELSVENEEEFMHELLMDKDFINLSIDYGE